MARPTRRPRVSAVSAAGSTGDHLVADRYLTARYAGCTARLWAARPAWLVTGTGPVLVGDAPAGAPVRIVEVCRTGPLIADLVVLAAPQLAPELWVAAPWHAVEITVPGPRADRPAARCCSSGPDG